MLWLPPPLGTPLLCPAPHAAACACLRYKATHPAPLCVQPVGCTTASGTKIEQAALRGVDSYGMLCSAYECGWVSEPGAC